jgi:hypothetical protein
MGTNAIRSETKPDRGHTLCKRRDALKGMKMKRLVLSVILGLLLSACASDESDSHGYRGRYGQDWECQKVFLAGHGYGQNYPPSCAR